MPAQVNLMKEFSEKIAESMPFVSVNFYVSNSRLLVRELTFCGPSGFERRSPSSWDECFGSWIKLRRGFS